MRLLANARGKLDLHPCRVDFREVVEPLVRTVGPNAIIPIPGHIAQPGEEKKEHEDTDGDEECSAYFGPSSSHRDGIDVVVHVGVLPLSGIAASVSQRYRPWYYAGRFRGCAYSFHLKFSFATNPRHPFTDPSMTVTLVL